jgi:hypothetical protein
MQATSDLAKLHGALQRRLLAIKLLYMSRQQRPSEDRQIVIGMAVIELDNTIVSGLREFTVSSLIGARTVSGHRISTNQAFATLPQISAFILSVMNTVRYQTMKKPASVPRRDEPTVRDPKDTEKILQKCMASNVGSLQNA